MESVDIKTWTTMLLYRHGSGAACGSMVARSPVAFSVVFALMVCNCGLCSAQQAAPAPEPEVALDQPAAGLAQEIAVPSVNSVAEAEAEAEAEPMILGPPNLPACIAEWTDLLTDMTHGVNLIIQQTTLCAEELGWYGQTPVTVSGGKPKNWDKRVGPFHSQRTCADSIVNMISKFAFSVADVESLMFDCFNNVQACGQSVSKATGKLLEGSERLIGATQYCAQPGSDAPFFKTSATPSDGFYCWVRIWGFIQRVVEAAKYIDVACSTCGMDVPMPEVEYEPEPEPDGGPYASDAYGSVPEPEPIDDLGVAQAVPADQAATEARGGHGFPDRGPWFEQPEPFAAEQDSSPLSPAERRRLAQAASAKASRELFRDFPRRYGHISSEAYPPKAEQVQDAMLFFRELAASAAAAGTDGDLERRFQETIDDITGNVARRRRGRSNRTDATSPFPWQRNREAPLIMV